MVRSYRDLKVWQAAMRLAELSYGYLALFPPRGSDGLRWQIERAVISIPSNIAEGHARDSSKEYLHYLSIALGSLAELETQIILATKLKFISGKGSDELLLLADEVGKMIRAIRRSVRARL